jgi:hypothetical protein
VDYLKTHKIPYETEDVFNHFNVNQNQGFKILRDSSSRKHHNNSDTFEQRGRHTKLNSIDLKNMDRILQDYGINDRKLTWKQLAYEADISTTVSTRTI